MCFKVHFSYYIYPVVYTTHSYNNFAKNLMSENDF